MSNNTEESSDHHKNNNKRKSKGKKLLFETKRGNEGDDEEGRKKMHRELEKQRRQEMTILYSSLRSLLPLEYIKGKRSISDQLNGAMNYINDLNDSIKELNLKKDRLQNIGSSKTPNLMNNVTINPSINGGVEILIISELIEKELPLSRVLELLLKEGQNVVSCIMTKLQKGVICKIECEVRDHLQTHVYLHELRQGLNDLLYDQ